MSMLGDISPYWLWFAMGGVLLVAETIVPGAFLVWFGLAALATGLLSLVADMGWQGQVLAFAGCAVVAVLIGRRIALRGGGTDRPFLNRRAEAQVGRVFTLEAPIADGAGHVRIDDSIWRISGPDLPAGAKVIVLRVEGTVLLVGPA
ncbi:conserved hypothetical protein [Azorhizobium caulinodans ORS 571]|uniref:NfeD-like C-terminal domain-containing protein n=1 Tax=Azorhizobium caulinodans (strain ATCC 43989 / DSM 5975 / JCM 20966 / LMG 6465 / NBRC 14845 / NCIMB 13405 / ORS 571) TaxID=438753 RepID=A8HV60_AZOC5|nr:conserved hypothetical protein [Azorhizobium caulinodans ORS 571]